jgi:hypothetical protein
MPIGVVRSLTLRGNMRFPDIAARFNSGRGVVFARPLSATAYRLAWKSL